MHFCFAIAGPMCAEARDREEGDPHEDKEDKGAEGDGGITVQVGGAGGSGGSGVGVWGRASLDVFVIEVKRNGVRGGHCARVLEEEG